MRGQGYRRDKKPHGTAKQIMPCFSHKTGGHGHNPATRLEKQWICTKDMHSYGVNEYLLDFYLGVNCFFKQFYFHL